MRTLWAVVLALLIAGFAGCVAGESPAEEASSTETSSEESTDAGSEEGTEPSGEEPADEPTADESAVGAIEGTVTDEELVPIVGASVTLVELELTATSDDAGAFSFADVVAGAYTLSATMEGYEEVTAPVEVVADGAAAVSLVMVALAAEGPLAITQEGEGLLSCGVGFPALTTSGDTACTLAFPSVRTIAFTITPGAKESLSEIVWVPTQSVLGSALRSVNSFNGGGAGEASGNTPIRIVFDDYDEDDEDDSTFSHFFWPAFGSANTGNPPHSVNVIVNQRITIYFTAFYDASVPEGFTAVPA